MEDGVWALIVAAIATRFLCQREEPALIGAVVWIAEKQFV